MKCCSHGSASRPLPESFEHPQPLVANQPTQWEVPLRDHDHVFLKGHRIMVQVQSTWFPVIDRNPQKFVPAFIKRSPATSLRHAEDYSTPGMESYLVSLWCHDSYAFGHFPSSRLTKR